ncbi:class I SAM-dependent methyltransferase, partial [Candidatus Peregrinibacteria bacterium]|nr:class I SAM-dependent methyltransferase [Candidatus Peregrinibacteria bacterium]
MSKPKIECVVGGEAIVEPLGGRQTNVGTVCDHCFPVYERAVDDFHAGGAVGSVKSFVRGKIADEVFVLGVLEEVAECEKKLKDAQKDAEKEPTPEEIHGMIMAVVEKALRDGVYYKCNVRELKKILMCGLKPDDFVSPEGRTGKGLDMKSALACMNEEERTFGFAKALFADIESLEKKKNEFEIVDAGCGPVPVFGILAALKSKKAKITCLEVDPASCKMAKAVVKKLGLHDRIEVKNADAEQYNHGKPIDLVVSETMYSGLTKEPLVQILDNLSGQVADGGAIIPRYVDVFACVTSGDYCWDNNIAVPFVWVVGYVPGNGKLPKIDVKIPLGNLMPGDYRIALKSN